MVLKLGTRRSALALAQSQMIANALMEKHPGLQVELVGMDTQGDRIQDVPLWKMEGKEFFTAELDQALLNSRVDFVVHSLKDLSLSRPEALHLAAIPQRENPRDVILFHRRTLEKLASDESIRVGTSSPRRYENIPSLLVELLPQLSTKKNKPHLKWVSIRGNVNSRIDRLKAPGDRELDAVVLAMAGIHRLGAETNEYLKMILPLNESPSAPGQGALALECRSGDEGTRKLLSVLHDYETEAQIKAERQILADWGGGCHTALGATMRLHPGLGRLLFIRGLHPRGERIQELRWNKPLDTGDVREAWNGMEFRAEIDEEFPEPKVPWQAIQPSIFVTHERALPRSLEETIKNRADFTLYAAGVRTWKKLALRGLWVTACAENLGLEWMKDVLGKKIDFEILTHSTAHGTQTYRLKAPSLSEIQLAQLKKSTHIFWSSPGQFEFLWEHCRKDAHHASGPGRTADAIAGKISDENRRKIFPQVEEWKKWVKLA